MDTQAMTFGSSSTPDDVQRQRDAIPPLKVNKMNLLSDALKIELKQLINEVLDGRDIEKKMNGPYDFPEDLI